MSQYRPNSAYQKSIYQQPSQAGSSIHPAQDVVSGDQYRYALHNFRLAHEKVEQQRLQLEEQERQVAQLREHLSKLEGGTGLNIQGPGGSSIDDFSVKSAASQLDKLINRWAAEVVRAPPVPIHNICSAILSDFSTNGVDIAHIEATHMQAQCYLRHAIAETISDGIINCLIVTNSIEANVQLTRVHEHIFARDPMVASVWRRQTFSAAVESCSPEMSLQILQEHVPELMGLLNNDLPSVGGVFILNSAYTFSRMLHASSANSGDAAFYRGFVPEIGSTLYPRQIELVKRCIKNERGEYDRVGATIFPGLVKVTQGLKQADGQYGDNLQTVVRRAQVICECALRSTGGAGGPPPPPPPPLPTDGQGAANATHVVLPGLPPKPI